MDDRRTVLILMGLAAAVLCWTLWGVRRKRAVGQVSYVPWHGLMFVSLTVLLLLVAHLPATE